MELERQLTGIRRHILRFGASVEQRVTRAIEALEQRNEAIAREVREGDAEINAEEIDIEHECLQVLALTHPVASDLRFIMTVLRINNDLERVGDKAKNISKRVLAMGGFRQLDLPDTLRQMGEETRRMLGNALSALANNDPDLASQVRRADDRVDQLQKELFTWAHDQIRGSVDRTEAVIQLLAVVRALERIADLSTNIAEDVIFLIGGQVVRHQAL
ncbi:MAG: phosphate signaling complex protein PhoU [Phycisphaeraceae bacterium]|nr:phosphate signaling complex protein PhoU [Phycisphaeraceae bacterium]